MRLVLREGKWIGEMYYGNGKKVMAAAVRIVNRLRETDATLRLLMKEYRCSYSVLMRAVRSQISEEEWEGIRKKKLTQGNAKSGTRFQKGHIPWMKGRKGIHMSPATEFKKGRVARNWRPVGMIVIRHDKLFRWQRKRNYKNGGRRLGKPRRWIKVKDDGRPQDRWLPYARYLWQQKYGAVPRGLFVVHKNSDQMDDRTENLILVNRSLHIKKNELLNPDMRPRAHKLACINRKKNTIIRKQLDEYYGQQLKLFMCMACGAEYEQDQVPVQCTKCQGGCFETIERRQKVMV